MRAVGATRFWMDGPAAIEPLRFRRMPMLAAALAFAAGDILARRWHGPALLAAATLALFLIAILAMRKAPHLVLLPVLALWISLGCWCAQVQPPVSTQATLTPFADGLSRTLRGRIARVRALAPSTTDEDTPQPSFSDPAAWEVETSPALQSIDLDVQAVEEVTPDLSTMQPVAGGVRLTILGDALPVACGDIVEVPLRLRSPDVYRDPGAWSYSDQLLGEGIGALATTKSNRLQIVSHAPGSWRCRLFAAQSWASRRMQAFVDSRANHSLPPGLRLAPEDAAMLNAMLFGDRLELSPSLRAGFERTGTFHLFVVSGLHIALLMGVVYWLLRRFRMPQPAAVLLTIAIAASYAALTGFGAPAQRALAMSAMYLLARWIGRKASALNALGAAALVVLAFDPRAIFEPGFQMTFLVILAVAGIASPLIERWLAPYSSALRHLPLIRVDASLPPRLAQFRVRVRMADELAAGLLGAPARYLPQWTVRVCVRVAEMMLLGIAAEVCMVIPMALYFHRTTVLALPLNVLDIPLVGILMCCAVATFCASLLSPWLALAPGAATALLLHLVHATVTHAQHLALADIRVPAPAPTAIVIACAAIAFCCWALRRSHRAPLIAGCVAMALVPAAILWPEPPLLHPGTLEVTAIDVGQGDSLLVVSPEGRTLLIDAGGPVGMAASSSPASGSNARWDVGEQVVAPYLWSRRIRRLDVVMLTHAHSDHMGGMPAVLRDLRPRELWLGVVPRRSPGLVQLMDEAHSLGITIRWFRAGDAFAWGGLQATVLAPEAGYTNPGVAVNNDSLVLRLAFGRASALLEGDAEAPSEAAMLANQRVTPSTLLKIGHHGSKTSTNPDFLAAVTPQDAVISVGRHNTFGHPRAEVLERLEAAHVKTFRTDRQGAETFLLTPDGRISAMPAASNQER
jgi:competence protein ComEC